MLNRNIDPGAADDPNELPLKKGEHLDIIDKSGKWWEARTSAGRKGSTYFVPLFSFCPFLKTDIISFFIQLRLQTIYDC